MLSSITGKQDSGLSTGAIVVGANVLSYLYNVMIFLHTGIIIGVIVGVIIFLIILVVVVIVLTIVLYLSKKT